jgi:pimeloyl-ACP methyl ester carboxylesterase
MAAVWRDLAAEVGQPVGVITHSMGGVVVNLAMREGWLRPRAVVSIAVPTGPDAYFGRMLAMAGLRNRDAIQPEVDRLLGRPLAAFSIDATPQAVPTLLIHDRDDRNVDMQQHAQVAARLPHARLLLTDGLGHNRILRAPTVLDASLRFIDETLAGTASHPIVARERLLLAKSARV